MIRIGVSDEGSTNSLGNKFGCSLPVAKHLIDMAFSLNMEVVGVRCVLSPWSIKWSMLIGSGP